MRYYVEAAGLLIAAMLTGCGQVKPAESETTVPKAAESSASEMPEVASIPETAEERPGAVASNSATIAELVNNAYTVNYNFTRTDEFTADDGTGQMIVYDGSVINVGRYLEHVTIASADKDAGWMEAYYYQAKDNTFAGYVLVNEEWQQVVAGGPDRPYGYGEPLEFSKEGSGKVDGVTCDIYWTAYDVNLSERFGLEDEVTAQVAQHYYIDRENPALVQTVTNLADFNLKTAIVNQMAAGDIDYSTAREFVASGGGSFSETVTMKFRDIGQAITIEIPDELEAIPRDTQDPGSAGSDDGAGETAYEPLETTHEETITAFLTHFYTGNDNGRYESVRGKMEAEDYTEEELASYYLDIAPYVSGDMLAALRDSGRPMQYDYLNEMSGRTEQTVTNVALSPSDITHPFDDTLTIFDYVVTLKVVTNGAESMEERYGSCGCSGKTGGRVDYFVEDYS